MKSVQPAKWPEWMDYQLVRRGIHDERVLRAFQAVPRGEFVSPKYRSHQFLDAPIPIGLGQTVSQPYVIAVSLQALELTGKEKVLDVGTGSGFQAVLLSYLAAEVFTVEVHDELYLSARLAIERLQKAPVRMRLGDGSMGWPEEAPFDGIVVGARAPRLPPSLAAQLAPRGRLVIPIGGEAYQSLYLISRKPDGQLGRRILERVMFVPLVGREGVGDGPLYV